MMKKLICIVALLSGLSVAAQSMKLKIPPLSEQRLRFPLYKGIYIPDFGNYYSTSVSEEIDFINLRVTYDMTLQIDTLVRRDRIVSEIGNRYTNFYSLYLREISLNFSDARRTVVYEWMRSCDAEYTGMLYIDLHRGMLQERILHPFTKDVLFTYEESLPSIKWEYDSATCELLGYLCLKAHCSFRGREWSVWYAPDLPAYAGFWKLNGLPGMILAAEDSSGEYCFTAVGIEQPDEPMLRYKIPLRKMKREKVQKIMRSAYDHPIDSFYVETGQNYFLLYRNEQILLVTHDECAPAPYSPLELE